VLFICAVGDIPSVAQRHWRRGPGRRKQVRRVAWTHVPRALCGHQQVCSGLRLLCRKRDDVQLPPAASGAPPFALVIRIGGLLVRARFAHVLAPAFALISYGSFCAGLLRALLSLAGDACPCIRTRHITHHCSGLPLGQALVRTLHRQGHAVVQGVACGVWHVWCGVWCVVCGVWCMVCGV